MPLADIVGQEKAISVLKTTLRKGIVAHCYLFSGEEGIGKSLAAKEFAKALICREVENDSCGQCAACRRIDSGLHPDMHIIGGEERQIKIDQVREIEEKLNVKSFEGGIKAVMVLRAETMNPAASNAFLKTLEEPPEESVLILVSSRPDLLPDTILSRAQRIRFYPLARADIERILRERMEPDPELRAGLAEGRLSAALDDELIERRDHFLSGLQNAMTGKADADQLWKDRQDMDDWFELATAWVRDLMVFKASRDDSLLANRDKRAAIEEFCAKAALKDLSVLLAELFRVKQLLRQNLNRHLTFEHILMQVRSVLG